MQKIILNQEELDYLCEKYQIIQNDRIEEAKQDKEMLDSLVEKGYFRKGEDAQYLILKDLKNVIEILRFSEGMVCAVREDNSNKSSSVLGFYFFQDFILSMKMELENYELLVLPSIPLAVGMMTNYIDEFKNQTTEVLKESTVEELGQVVEEILQNHKIEKQWAMFSVSRDGKMAGAIQMWECENEQFAAEINEGKIAILKPDKETLVHMYTKWIVELQRQAIGAKENQYGRI